MADNKKYYYFKLKEGFFDSPDMIILESYPDGMLYSNILLKLYALSLADDGKLMFKGRIPYTPEILAKIVRHPQGVVEKAIKEFQNLGLVEILDSGAIYMLDVQSLVGKGSTEAERKAKYRNRIDTEKKLIECDNKAENKALGQCPGHFPPEIEIELELELELNKNSCSSSDERDDVLNIDELFALTYSEYPRKEGKAKGELHYRNYLTIGKTIGKRKYKYNHQQLYIAVQQYADDQKGKENQYIAMFSTFMSSLVVDYVEKTADQYQEVMQSKYGDGWEAIRFEYR